MGHQGGRRRNRSQHGIDIAQSLERAMERMTDPTGAQIRPENRRSEHDT